MFDVKFCQLLFVFLVLLVNDIDLVLHAWIQINTIYQTPLERVCTTFAIETKEEFAVLATTSVFCLLHVGQAVASLKRTPTYVIHLGNCVLEALLLVLFNDFLFETHSLYIMII